MQQRISTRFIFPVGNATEKLHKKYISNLKCNGEFLVEIYFQLKMQR